MKKDLTAEKRLKKLKKDMFDRHMSPAIIAKQAEVSRQFMYQVLRGERPLPLDAEEKIYAYLNKYPPLASEVLANNRFIFTFAYERELLAEAEKSKQKKKTKTQFEKDFVVIC